jgi:hypothetical protein
MSFATLCLHLVHVRMAKHKRRFSRSTDHQDHLKDRAIFFLLHHTVGCRAQGSGQFVIGPVKFFGEVCCRRTTAWRGSSTEETQSLDSTAFIEAKRRKRANASATDECRRVRRSDHRTLCLLHPHAKLLTLSS